MAEVAERHYLDEHGVPESRISGLAVTRHGYGRPTRLVRVVEAGHPMPDAAGLAATVETLDLADSAGAEDLVLVLISGGASANWIAPAAGLSLADKQAATRALLACGASIVEINTVRKHLSRIKGGRLAQRAYPARLVAVGISDVPGDDPAVIGSGPTVPDPTTLADARAIVARHRLELSPLVTRALADPANETPKPGDAGLRRHLVRAGDTAGRGLPRRRGRGTRRRIRVHPARHGDRGRGARGRRRAGTTGARSQGAGAPRRDPLGRRAHGDAARSGPRRAQPGIRAGAGGRARGGAAGSRRSPATPTAPMAGPVGRTIRPAPSSMQPPLPAPAASASIRPSFSTTTIRPNSLRNLAIC